MTEAQGDILAEELEPEYSDLKSLLEAAKNSEFSLSTGFTEEKTAFERADSLFDLIKSEGSSQDRIDSANEPDQESDSFETQDMEDTRAAENIENFTDIEELGDKNNLSDIDNIDSDFDSEPSLYDESSEKIDLNSSSGKEITKEADNESQNLEALEEQSTDENLDDEEKKIGELVFTNKSEKNAYDAGYKAALDEFENSMNMEKNSIENLLETMFSVGENFQDQLEKAIKSKVQQLANDVIGSQMQEFQASFLKVIKTAAADIIEDAANIKLELSHLDFAILDANANIENIPFDVLEKSDLRRGEFRLISNTTDFQQKYSQ